MAFTGSTPADHKEMMKRLLRPSFMERAAEQGGLTTDALHNAQMGKDYSGILAEAARQRGEQIRMQQEWFPQREEYSKLMERAGLVVALPAPAPKPAPKPKADPFPTAKRIIKLKD